jgi:CheY-like chemotaxis protein
MPDEPQYIDPLSVTQNKATELAMGVEKKLIAEAAKSSEIKNEGGNPGFKQDAKIQNNYNWRGYTILIVEDNFISFKLLEVLLRNSQAIIHHADNGLKAIEKVKLFPEINLVLMDIQLPVINGYEATAEIKKIRADLPVIAQTANTMDDDSQKCASYGCDGYITKPINFELLFKLVDGFLRKKE